MTAVVRPMVEADRDDGFRAFVDSYGGGPALLESTKELPLANRWVLEDDARIVGIMRGLPFEQAFGGRFVPSMGVAAVAIAPTARSRGGGRALMAGFLRDQHEAGTPLSTLYFSTAAPYRRVGYEVAGVRIRYALALDYLPRGQELEVTSWTDDDLPAVDACLRRVALVGNGPMGRPDWWWHARVFNPLEQDQFLYRYLVREADRVTGAVVFTIHMEGRADLPIQWVAEKDAIAIATRDLFWETPAAGRSLLGFLAGHRALGTDLLWTGPAQDPVALLIPEHAPRFLSGYRWMARLCHVTRALESRGYPPHVAGTVRLHVEDGTLPGNDGPIQIEFEGGRATVTPASAADASITIGGLSSLYTGYADPATLVSAGLLRDVDSRTEALLREAFQGPSPWMAEFF